MHMNKNNYHYDNNNMNGSSINNNNKRRRRPTFEQAKADFVRVVTKQLQWLEEEEGYNRDRAVKALLQEIRELAGPQNFGDEKIFEVMRQHKLSWEQAARALLVSQAVDNIKTNTDSEQNKVHTLTELTRRIQEAKLLEHTIDSDDYDLMKTANVVPSRNILPPRTVVRSTPQAPKLAHSQQQMKPSKDAAALTTGTATNSKYKENATNSISTHRSNKRPLETSSSTASNALKEEIVTKLGVENAAGAPASDRKATPGRGNKRPRSDTTDEECGKQRTRAAAP